MQYFQQYFVEEVSVRVAISYNYSFLKILWFDLVMFYDISTINTKSIFIHINSAHFECQKYFYIKLFRLTWVYSLNDRKRFISKIPV